MKDYCPACLGASLRSFYRVGRIPVHSVINIGSREEALGFTRGDLRLAVCQECGLIFNQCFDPEQMHYGVHCEETQGFSPVFSRWHRNLAQDLIQRFDLRNKSILEIGCGKGEFLTMLCEIAEAHGVGFDPAYIPDRNHSPARKQIQFIRDLYSEKYSSIQADFVCCKMTLEHIGEPLGFLETVRRSLGERYQTHVFFQVPNIRRVLTEVAFWDIYYEHCNYFSLGSLARIFRRAGFNVLDLMNDYAGQYIMIDAIPGTTQNALELPEEEGLETLLQEVSFFERRAAEVIGLWRNEFERIRDEHRRVVLWGSGSKAVSFLSTIGIPEAIPYVVDINPYRQGTYLAGNGQLVVPPEFLVEYRPSEVLVMNEVYVQEVRRDLMRFDLKPELRPVCDRFPAAATAAGSAHC